MVDYPIIRFVAGLGSTVARLDLNDASPWITTHDDFSFGTPTYEGQPRSVGATYRERTVQIPAEVQGDSDVAFSALSDLAVELQRRDNWLMVQYDAASQPVWLRTYRTEPPELDTDDVYVGRADSRWVATFTVKADAFAYLDEVTIPTQTISNDPTAGGVTVALPDIEGDAPTDLSIAITSAADMFALTWLCATSIVDQGCTYDFNASPITLPTADFSLASGAPLGALTPGTQPLGGQYRRTTSVPDSWTPMLVNPTGANIPVGNYRVLGRLRQTAISGDAGFVAFSVGGAYTDFVGTSYHWQPQRKVFPSSEFLWHDLGSLYLPVGARPDGPDLQGSRRFGVRCRAVSGDAPSIDFGGFMLIPIASDADFAAVVDSRVLKANIGAASVTAGNTIRFDADGKRIERTPRNLPLPNAIAAGGYPMVQPGYANYLHLTSELGELGSLSGGDLTREFSVTVSYYPRVLNPLRRV